ncbi:hypothetical protein [Mycobacterium talmoniae]
MTRILQRELRGTGVRALPVLLGGVEGPRATSPGISNAAQRS